jgi:hypothetical protein
MPAMMYVDVEVQVETVCIVGSGQSPVTSCSVPEESADQNMRTSKEMQQGDKHKCVIRTLIKNIKR